MEFEDFEFSDDEFAKDNQLTIVDSARVMLLDNIEKAIKSCRQNLQFNEATDFQSNLNIISKNISAMLSLNEIDSNLPENEVQERIDKVIQMSTELTFSNIDTIIKDHNDDDDDTSQLDDLDEDTDETDW